MSGENPSGFSSWHAKNLGDRAEVSGTKVSGTKVTGTKVTGTKARESIEIFKTMVLSLPLRT